MAIRITAYLSGVVTMMASTGLQLDESKFFERLSELGDGSYAVPTEKALNAASRRFASLLDAEADITTLRDHWEKLGFEVTQYASGERQLIERARVSDGRGAYLLRPGASRKIMLQAPHRGYDRLTGKIAWRLFQDGDFAAAGWNTLHRYSGHDGDREGADLARVESSYWTRLSDAFLDNDVDALILQLHGFNPDRRRTTAARQADMIISSGTRPPSRAAATFAACLKRRWPGTVLLYPRDVDELGGVRNPLSRQEKNRGRRGFIHLELSPAARRRLTDDRSMRLVVRDCLP